MSDFLKNAKAAHEARKKAEEASRRQQDSETHREMQDLGERLASEILGVPHSEVTVSKVEFREGKYLVEMGVQGVQFRGDFGTEKRELRMAGKCPSNHPAWGLVTGLEDVGEIQAEGVDPFDCGQCQDDAKDRKKVIWPRRLRN